MVYEPKIDMFMIGPGHVMNHRFPNWVVFVHPFNIHYYNTPIQLKLHSMTCTNSDFFISFISLTCIGMYYFLFLSVVENSLDFTSIYYFTIFFQLATLIYSINFLKFKITHFICIFFFLRLIIFTIGKLEFLSFVER